ncbi:DUF4468 domain-containing protein [Hoylesella enoeca]|uniref:DUF4468 domain-containing protein n=1 Tax=Hoylesella enoeca TaxID=76123 RepID=A0A0S2KJS5_9BACT|nr:DUF4468 domain-containing protein [Hoylesella enoeca]ALO48485.1 hypothetical protein AS203_04815 [Hoylesella enoeca]
MKKLIAILLTILPLTATAQDVWEKPQDSKQQVKQTVEKAKKDEIKQEDAKYLSGAVPEVDGKVVFTLDLSLPGKSAQDIYDQVYAQLDKMSKEDNQFKESGIVLINKRDHIIAAHYKEWLIFTNNFISLDRTELSYTIIAKCMDGQLNLTLSRISYSYEKGRSTGFNTTAEKWIVDAVALNKRKTKLTKGSAKFRRKTIDRKDEIFSAITNALK